MLRIEPVIQIHTSRTGAWRFSATFRDAIRQRTGMPIIKTAHFCHFLRLLSDVSMQAGKETWQPRYSPAGIARQDAFRAPFQTRTAYRSRIICRLSAYVGVLLGVSDKCVSQGMAEISH
jgi:hypothetical protein